MQLGSVVHIRDLRCITASQQVFLCIVRFLDNISTVCGQQASGGNSGQQAD
jgi:hypothetical protein